MFDEEDFKDEAFKDKTMKIHTEISLTLSKHLKNQEAWHDRETGRQYFLAQIQEAWKVLDSLDICLEKDYFEAYLEQHAILWQLLEELGLAILIAERISRQFGEHCFFTKLSVLH